MDTLTETNLRALNPLNCLNLIRADHENIFMLSLSKITLNLVHLPKVNEKKLEDI